MKRKTDKDVIREHKGIVLLFTVIALLGIFVALTPLFPKEEFTCEKKEIKISKVTYGWISSGKYSISRHTVLMTDEGEKYNTDGHKYAELEGETVTVTYYETGWLFREKHIDTITWHGKTLQAHSDPAEVHWYIPVIVETVMMIIGAGGLAIVYLEVRRNRRMQNARNQRIIKKYGDKAKIQ